MKKRLLYLALALFGAPLLMGQSTVVCTTSSPGTVVGSCASGVTSPVTTDPLSFSGVVTFDNAANTPVTFSDGATVKAGTGTGTLSVGGVICKGAPADATAGTTEEVLATCTIPANTLSANGSMLRVNFLGHSAANYNNKQLRIRMGGIGGLLILDTNAFAANNLNILNIMPFVITRTSATTATCAAHVGWSANSAASGTYSSSGVLSLRAAAITWANANDLVITGTTPTAAGDMTLDTYSVEVVQ